MTASSSPCPNCGASMVVLPRGRQSTGHREVVLEWVICVPCRHVRLEQWAFIGEEDDGQDVYDQQHRA